MSTTAPLGRRLLRLPRPPRFGSSLDRIRGHVGTRLEPVRRAVTPYVARGRGLVAWVSLNGWLAVTGTAVGLVVGLSQSWTEFVTLGLVCGVALLLALAWTLGRTSLDVTFDLHQQRVTVGETASGRVVLCNRARRSLFPTRIELRVGRGRAHFMLPSLGHDESHEQLFDVPTRRRSVIPIGPVTSVRSDPLGLLRRTQRWSDSVDLYVHPITVSLSSDSTGFIRDIEGVTTQDLSSNDVSFHALREYQPGDDRRAIHWRTTARVGKLMVRQFEETRRAHLLVVLATGESDHASEADLESAISIAGSLARHAYQEEREVSIFTSSGLLRFGAAPLMLDRLAELAPAAAAVPMRELTARAVRAVPHASVCAFVVGDVADARDLRSAHRTLPASVSSFALRCGSTAELSRRRIGDLTVVDLPDVASLPRAMRSLG